MRDSNNIYVLYRLFDIVTESEPEFTDEKIVPAGGTRSNYNYIWSTIYN